MNRYTLYCTESQTRKALELGAPILSVKNAVTRDEIPHFVEGELGKEWTLYFIPTADQMIGWLEEQGFDFEATKIYTVLEHDKSGTLGFYEGARKEAIIIAIDAALEYLSKNKN